ncbi:MAG: DUF389 domain-containing protein [Cyanobacteriota bacterium]|nr:DUF389 domain-containing protein [Cyanobacteriota bacterium]
MAKPTWRRAVGVWGKQLRRGFSQNLDLSDEQKAAIYIQLAESVSLRDISFWLEVIFAAGVATLGLVLNSPAVIIGAMLISPLMGGILANGLALAMGDIVLAIRSLVNLTLSSTLAVFFALGLVILLPFQEITSEIAARTQPNLLDLIVALFSGAVGAVATCKQIKGVAASLPGVAIAVALMPPLCVVGYGIGTALSSGHGEGWVLARGAGLLFFTNLVAIIFASLIVFFFIRFDYPRVQNLVMDWKAQNPDIQPTQAWVDSLPLAPSLKTIGNLPSRIFLILIALGVISLPLTQSLGKLRAEILSKREETRLREQITALWQTSLAQFGDGQPRAYLNRLNFQKTPDLLTVNIQAVTRQLFSAEEKARFTQDLAGKLNRPPQQIFLNLIEIPSRQLELGETSGESSPDLTWGELGTQTQRLLTQALRPISFPPETALLGYRVLYSLDSRTAPRLQALYLADRPLQADAEFVLGNQIRGALGQPELTVEFSRLASDLGVIPPGPALTDKDRRQLDEAGKALRQYPNLRLELTYGLQAPEAESRLLTQLAAVRSYLQQTWGVLGPRLLEKESPGAGPGINLRLFNSPTSPASLSPNPEGGE